MSKHLSKVQMVRALHKYSNMLDAASHIISPPAKGDTRTPDGLARTSILFGLWLIVAVFGAFGLWSAFAPLESAALAAGVIVLDSNRKSIQHLEGGQIEEILVREGSQVKAGEPLIKLNPIASEARLDLYKGQYASAKATEVRLIAERDGVEKLVFPKELEDQRSDPKINDILETQQRQFETRKQSVSGQVGILQQKAEQSRKEIEGLNAQIDSASDQIKFLNEEIKTVQYLLSKGNAQKPRLLALQRNKAQLEGQRGEHKALIARAEQTIAETELAVNNQKNDFQGKVSTELKETQSQLSDLQERIKASSDVMSRIVINSPVNGFVTGLSKHTVGGVIQAGEKIMDIVPIGDKLVVEAHVSPQDIDVVREGLVSRVWLSAYKSRNLPPVEGTVVSVSRDRFTEERSGVSYFLTRIEIKPDEISNLKGVELTAGMPADVRIVTGSRTLMQYLLSPISESFRQAFRED